MAPAKASPTMFMKDGKYSAEVHHNSHLAVGVPGTVAGLHLAWKEQGKLPWKRLVDPAVALARDGFTVTEGLSVAEIARRTPLPASMQKYPGVGRAFTGTACRTKPGDTLKQPDLARTLERIASPGSGRVLRRRDRARAREGDARERRPDHARGPEEVRGEDAGAGQGHLPRIRGHRRCRRQLRRHRRSSRC